MSKNTAIEQWKVIFSYLISRIEQLGSSDDWAKIPVAEAFLLMSNEEHAELREARLPMTKIETAYDLRREWQAKYSGKTD